MADRRQARRPRAVSLTWAGVRARRLERSFLTNRGTDLVAVTHRVGGIHANATLPADFLFENLMIGANVINATYRAGVRRLVNLGSSCMYPREATQPIGEATLMTGPLEPTNEAYAIAKIATAGMVTMEDLIEEILGDVRDEHDEEERDVRRVADGWDCSGLLRIDEVLIHGSKGVERLLDGGRCDLVQLDATWIFQVQHMRQMPGDRLTLAIGI